MATEVASCLPVVTAAVQLLKTALGKMTMKPLNHLWLRTTAGLSEQLTDNSVVSELWAHSHLTKAALPLQSDARRLNALLKACRRLSVPPSRRWLNAQLKSFVVGPKSDVARRNWTKLVAPPLQLAYRFCGRESTCSTTVLRMSGG